MTDDCCDPVRANGPPLPSKLRLAFAVCRTGITAHRYVKFCDGLKRRCADCGREDWVMGNPYPRIGEPAHYWERMR